MTIASKYISIFITILTFNLNSQFVNPKQKEVPALLRLCEQYTSHIPHTKVKIENFAKKIGIQNIHIFIKNIRQKIYTLKKNNISEEALLPYRKKYIEAIALCHISTETKRPILHNSRIKKIANNPLNTFNLLSYININDIEKLSKLVSITTRENQFELLCMYTNLAKELYNLYFPSDTDIKVQDDNDKLLQEHETLSIFLENIFDIFDHLRNEKKTKILFQSLDRIYKNLNSADADTDDNKD